MLAYCSSPVVWLTIAKWHHCKFMGPDIICPQHAFQSNFSGRPHLGFRGYLGIWCTFMCYLLLLQLIDHTPFALSVQIPPVLDSVQAYVVLQYTRREPGAHKVCQELLWSADHCQQLSRDTYIGDLDGELAAVEATVLYAGEALGIMSTLCHYTPKQACKIQPPWFSLDCCWTQRALSMAHQYYECH